LSYNIAAINATNTAASAIAAWCAAATQRPLLHVSVGDEQPVLPLPSVAQGQFNAPAEHPAALVVGAGVGGVGGELPAAHMLLRQMSGALHTPDEHGQPAHPVLGMQRPLVHV